MKVLITRRTALALAFVGLGASASAAQSTFTITPSMLVSFVSDSNLLAAATVQESDTIARVSPIVDVDLRTPRIAVLARATGDIERFAHNTSLTSLDARKQFSVDAAYRVQERLTVRVPASYLQTQVPGELNVATGLTLARGQARRIAIAPAATYQHSENTQGLVRYTINEDRLDDGAPVTTHVASLAGVRRLAPRATMRVEYLMRGYVFGATDHVRSHTLSVGWTRDVTRTTRVSIAGGPRINDGSVAPDLSALLEYGGPVAGASLGYTRAETVLIGLSGVSDTDSVSLSAFSGRADRLRIRIAPGVMRTARAGLASRVYRIAIGAARPLHRGLAVDVSYEALEQRGDLYVERAGNRISRHVVIVSLSVAQPRRMTP